MPMKLNDCGSKFLERVKRMLKGSLGIELLEINFKGGAISGDDKSRECPWQ